MLLSLISEPFFLKLKNTQIETLQSNKYQQMEYKGTGHLEAGINDSPKKQLNKHLGLKTDPSKTVKRITQGLQDWLQ